jgi:hypothetical protein
MLLLRRCEDLVLSHGKLHSTRASVAESEKCVHAYLHAIFDLAVPAQHVEVA